MTEGADDGAALPCSPWAGDAADCCWGDGVLSQALRWSLLDLGGAIPMSSSGRVCPSVLIRDACVALGVILIDHGPNA